jgi:hypothetical protein
MRIRTALRALTVAVLLPTALMGTLAAGTAAAGTVSASTVAASTVATGQTPGTVFLQTVPALGGVRFLVDAIPVTTQPDGSAKVAVPDFNEVASKVTLASTIVNTRDTVALKYIQAAAHSVKYESHLTIGLDVTSKVTLQISSGATQVAPSTVKAVQLHSVNGLSISVDPQNAPTVGLLSRQSRLVAGVVTSQVVTWSVDSVVAGSGVSVTTQQTSFDPFASGVWPLVLQPVKGTVIIQTVPAIGGVRLLVGSIPVTTQSNGSATVAVPDVSKLATTISLASTALDDRNTLTLAYVQAGAYSVKYERRLTIGLDVTSQVALQISAGTTGVAPNTVQAVHLHSVTGLTTTVDPQSTSTVTLLSRQTRLVAGVVTSQVVTWTVDSVVAAPGISITTQQANVDPLASAVWSLVLQPVKGTVVIDTVPAMAHVSFVLEGASFTTDAQGHATAPVADLNGINTGLRLASPESGGSTLSLLRVFGLPPAGPFQRHVIAALSVSRAVSLTFTGSDGQPFPADHVAEVDLNGGGQTVRVTGARIHDPVSLLAQQARLVDGTWQTQEITYTVAKATADGSDAVFAGQQRFNPSSGTWPISLSVFTVTVTVRDVLFGTRVTSAAEMTRPDGVRYSVQLVGGRPTLLRSVVRGQYTLTTRSAVLGANSKILVSKNSDVELRVVTLADVIIIGLLLLGLAVAVVMVGVVMSRRATKRQTGLPA